MTASAPSRLDVFCPTDAPELDERLTANGYTGGTTTKLARFLIARAMRSEPDERLLPHLLPVEPLVQTMWGEGWINCNEGEIRAALRTMNATARTGNRYPIVSQVWYVRAGQDCPKTGVTVAEDAIGYTLSTKAIAFHLSARVVDLPLMPAQIAPAVKQDARLDAQTKHVYSWLLAIGISSGLHRPLKFSRSLFRKAVEESCAIPGLMWSNGTLRAAAKQLKAVGLVKRMHVGDRSADENSIVLVLNSARDQYSEERWAAAEASAEVSGLPHRMERLTPSKPAKLPSSVHGDQSLSIWSKHVYGFLMQRVLMSGEPEWRAPYLIPVAPFITRLNEFAAEQGEAIVPSRVTLAETMNKLKQKGLIQKYGFASQGPHTGCLRFRPPHPRCAYAVQTWEEMEEKGKTEEGRDALWAKAHGGKTIEEAAALTETQESQMDALPVEAEALLAILLRNGDVVRAASGKLCEVTLKQAREDYKQIRPKDRAVGTKLKRAAVVLAERGFVKWIEGFKKSIAATKILRYRLLDDGVNWSADSASSGFHKTTREMVALVRKALEEDKDPKEALMEFYGVLKERAVELAQDLTNANRECAELAVENALLEERNTRMERGLGLSHDGLLFMVLVTGRIEDEHGTYAELDSEAASVSWRSEAEMKTDYEALAAARGHAIDDATFSRAAAECFARGVVEPVENTKGYTVRITEAAVEWASERAGGTTFLTPLFPPGEAIALDGGGTLTMEELIDYVETWRERFDLTAVHDQFPNVTLFHESTTNNEEIGPHERRVLAVHTGLAALHEELEQKYGFDAFRLLDVQWEQLLTEEERGPRLGKTLARLVRGGYAFLPEFDRMRPKSMKALRKRAEERPDEHVPVSMAFRKADEWSNSYSDTYIKVAERIARRHGSTVRRAQLTLPDDLCPCASGQPAEMCCQVHSVNRATSLHYGVTVGLAEAYRVNGVESAVTDGKIQRNDPCPCWSGKKYKKCCGGAGRTYEGLAGWFAASWRGSA